MPSASRGGGPCQALDLHCRHGPGALRHPVESVPAGVASRSGFYAVALVWGEPARCAPRVREATRCERTSGRLVVTASLRDLARASVIGQQVGDTPGPVVDVATPDSGGQPMRERPADHLDPSLARRARGRGRRMDRQGGGFSKEAVSTVSGRRRICRGSGARR